MIKRVHHIDFVVRDLDRAVEAYEQIFQRPITDRIEFLARGVELAWFVIDGVRIILVCPNQKDSPVQKFLDDHGEGFFHIAYEVDSIDSALKTYQLQGLDLHDGEKRKGVEGWDIIDLKMKDTLGVLTQLIEVSD